MAGIVPRGRSAYRCAAAPLRHGRPLWTAGGADGAQAPLSYGFAFDATTRREAEDRADARRGASNAVSALNARPYQGRGAAWRSSSARRVTGLCSCSSHQRSARPSPAAPCSARQA